MATRNDLPQMARSASYIALSDDAGIEVTRTVTDCVLLSLIWQELRVDCDLDAAQVDALIDALRQIPG